MHVEIFKILTFCPFEKHLMTGTALHTNEILQVLVLDKIVITFTANKNLIKLLLFQRGYL